MADLSTKQLYSQIETPDGLNLSFHFHTDTFQKTLNAVFARALAKMGLPFLLDAVVTILKEIIANAVKANAKRVYFQKLNLDANDPESYKKGMANFSEEIAGNIISLKDDLKNSEYRVRISISKSSEGLNIIITNNAPILPEELKRIHMRVDKGKQVNDFTDAYDEISDDTEGAGLGIVLTILLMKKTGIGEESYKIRSDGSNTISQFKIPLQPIPGTITTKIKEQIVKDVNGLPSFPEHILALQKLCKNPETSIDKIVEKTKLDPALSSDILKLSNSAGFVRGKRVENINDAIMVIGINNLNDILIVTSARRLVDTKYKKLEEIWSHCNKVAFYAKNIALKYGFKNSIENAYMGGLLHDIGKIVLLASDAKLVNWVSDIIKDRGIRTSTVMEEVSLGISHSTIGELMANKWHFPDYLIEAVKYHHSPLCAKDEFKELLFIIYLANMLCGIEMKKYHFFYVEEEILEKFNITSESQFKKLHEELVSIHGKNK